MSSPSITSTLQEKCYFCGRDANFFKDLFRELFDIDSKTEQRNKNIKFLEAKLISPVDLKIYEKSFKAFSSENSSLLKKSMLNLTMDFINSSIDEYSKEVPETIDVLSFYKKIYMEVNRDYKIQLKQLIDYYLQGKYIDDVNKKNKSVQEQIDNEKMETVVKLHDDFVMKKLLIGLGGEGYRGSEKEFNISICPVCFEAYKTMGGNFDYLLREKRVEKKY